MRHTDVRVLRVEPGTLPEGVRFACSEFSIAFFSLFKLCSLLFLPGQIIYYLCMYH